MVAMGLSAVGASGVQTLTVLSAPAETTRRPSALMPTPVTGPACAASDLSSLPSPAFQSFTVLSSPAETMRSPLGLNAAWRTGPAWDACQGRGGDHTLAVLSAPAVTICLPSLW